MRSYSLSGEPSAERYRVSIKREVHGAASIYIDDPLRSATSWMQAQHAAVSRCGLTTRPLYC